ncbi:MAG: ORF6N domain-containing protein [Gallionella sp.]|nr:ORF6N domain-containing protein [Gallionella sp.]
MRISSLKKLIIEIRGQSVLLDSDVAKIYGVETKRTNGAAKNNPDKFRQDYMLGLSEAELSDLPRRESCLTPSPKKACICSLQYCEASKP